jgi:hypothetical protein
MCELELKEVEEECKSNPYLRGAERKPVKYGPDDYGVQTALPDGRKGWANSLQEFYDWVATIVVPRTPIAKSTDHLLT